MKVYVVLVRDKVCMNDGPYQLPCNKQNFVGLHLFSDLERAKNLEATIIRGTKYVAHTFEQEVDADTDLAEMIDRRTSLTCEITGRGWGKMVQG